ncbi:MULTISPECIES: hypothetical protein [unclassified Aeromicrobium]|uniref:hypothetical protein n=1 Tax=unclassified Aeromicrobium TaxID=2633570 RepID=UPI000B2FAA72|nr:MULTISPECIES: hypothetical protein [unclassified Aeromicrobium]
MTANGRLESADWWFSQGDIFSSMPLVDTAIGPGVGLAALPRGYAVLVTHGCVLDKQNARGESQADHMTFLRLIDVAKQPQERAAMLRRMADDVQPYRVMYLGEVDGFGEAFVDLGQPLTHEVSVFQAFLREFQGEERRLTGATNSDRSQRLTSEAVDLFHQKWVAHWTRLAVEV